MHPPLFLRRLFLYLVFTILFVRASAEVSRPAKRSYSTHDYYVLEHDPAHGVSVQGCADALGAELVEQAGQLRDHWILRSQRTDGSEEDRVLKARGLLEENPTLTKRDALPKAIRHLSRQVPRQRVKRAAVPAPPPGGLDDADGKSSARDIAERLGIEDPMFKDQWHLVNEEYPEHMMNATPIWDMGITGKGVISCMVDDGLDFESEDLADNFDAVGSYDFNDHVDLPKPMLSDDRHGTRCAGQIAAVKNGVCGVGIAYESKVAGVRILSGPISDVDEAAALNYGYQNTSIYSCSWGPADDGKSMEAPSVLIQKAMLNGVQNGRDGKGSVYVFASGNGAHSGDQCNFDGYTNSIYSVTVASIDYKGEHPYYSESCAANMITTYSSGSDRKKQIVTTDVGKASCTTHHGGTSAAAPNAVGVFALALSVRPDLTWRDVQHLCVKTAQVVNPSDATWELTATGQPYSYKFGFGKLDAFDFVTAAQQWTSVKPQAWVEAPPVQLENGTMDKEGKFSGGIEIEEDGVQSTIEITQEMMDENNFEALEHVTVRVWIEHSRRGDVEVTLTSPNGIRSMLAEKRHGDRDKDGFPGWRFMSVKHWGENPVGTWTLTVSDQDREDESGNFIGWRLSLWGSAKDSDKAVPYALKISEELPIPFPPPEEAEPTPDAPHTTAVPSTTKSFPKPTAAISSVPGQEDVESTAGQATATSSSDSSSMDNDTRFRIAILGFVFAGIFIAGGAILIIRRIRQNRRNAQRRAEEGEGEDVRMRLLDNEAQRPLSLSAQDVSTYDDEPGERERGREGVSSGGIGFHSGFLDEDEEEETRAVDGNSRYSDAESRDEADESTSR
ncbi:uncharacterized protein FOMMEDRAFT_110361 [Fomitiporia mediterranea MF3/22]|uniref:uncharacterized protein n=1 Tax=Fomitiporia mediterranea (strain MF3/22) TaxID=694068 RepID=UPI0004408BC4|nr:uncharacterized protein FOMMEDRAFT_110361 [Fomitiporia mediterranea MF3/22]EJD00927.1 hypothetical protein FOMMEDRAFT_110361 [Fomitiporia mediterranea MF3/22]